MSMSIIDSQEPAYLAEHEIDVLTKRIAKLEANKGTRWHELFGTPERAAQTLVLNCKHQATCGSCIVADEIPGGACCDYDTLLGWLRGKAVKQ